MELITLTLQNFKKAKDFTLNAQGKNVTVLGRNGAGKTTLKDAFLWLLFDKDSKGRSPEGKGFELKTRDSNGQVISGLEHSVEAVFIHEGRTITLKKVFTENWATKRGSAVKEFKGHETAYFVDDVPYKLKDYDALIASIIDEERFRLITDPMYFNRLEWKKRREIMLALCSDVTDNDVFSAAPELEIVRELIEAHGTENGKALLMSRRKNWNDKLQQIPVRIDETNKGLEVPAGAVDIASLKVQKEALEEQKKALIAQIQNAGKVASEAKNMIYNQINNVTMQLNKNKDLRREAEREQQVIKDGLKRHETRIEQAKEAIADIERRYADLAKEILAKEQEKAVLSADWIAKRAETLPEIDTECPTCGQVLPEDQAEKKKAEAAEKFNDKKAREIKFIEDKGAKINNEISSMKTRLADLEGHKADQLATVEKAAQTLATESAQAETTLPDYSKQNEMLEKQLADHRAKADAPADVVDTSKLDESLREIDVHMADIARTIANQDAYTKAQARIKELLDEESRIGAELAMVEGQLLAVEKFIMAKADLQENSLNSMFKNITFRLFDRQVNGGIDPTFVTMVDGVSYADINDAAVINCGMEIIGYLCERYGITAPVFVDKKESVTDLYPIKSQVICLEVSKEHKTLTMEVA